MEGGTALDGFEIVGKQEQRVWMMGRLIGDQMDSGMQFLCAEVRILQDSLVLC